MGKSDQGCRHQAQQLARPCGDSLPVRRRVFGERHFRALLPVSTAGFRSPNDTGYGESAVLERLSEVGLEADATSVLRPRAMFLTGLVGDLIGVATKRRRPREAAPPLG